MNDAIEYVQTQEGSKVPLIHLPSAYNLDRNNACDYSKAQREPGYCTRPYAEILRDEARWMAAGGRIKGKVNLYEVSARKTSVADKLLSTMESRTMIQNVVKARSVEAMDHLLRHAGIDAYSDTNLHTSFREPLSRCHSNLMALFEGRDYNFCCWLSALGI